MADSRNWARSRPNDPLRTRREDPRTVALQLALWDGGCRGLRAKRGGNQLRPSRSARAATNAIGYNRRAKCVGDRLRQRGRTLDARTLTQPPAQRLGITAVATFAGTSSRNDTAGTRELEGALDEGNGKIG